MQALELAGIGPPTAENRSKIAGVDVGVVDVGDFELVASGRFERADVVERALIVEVDCRLRRMGSSGCRFFFNADDALADDLGNPEAFGIRNLFEQNPRAAALCFETLAVRSDVILEDVVAENDADAVVIGKVLAKPERVGDAAFAFLIRVVDVLETELAPVTEEPQEVAGGVTAGNDHDLA